MTFLVSSMLAKNVLLFHKLLVELTSRLDFVSFAILSSDPTPESEDGREEGEGRERERRV